MEGVQQKDYNSSLYQHLTFSPAPPWPVARGPIYFLTVYRGVSAANRVSKILGSIVSCNYIEQQHNSAVGGVTQLSFNCGVKNYCCIIHNVGTKQYSLQLNKKRVCCTRKPRLFFRVLRTASVYPTARNNQTHAFFNRKLRSSHI